MDTYTTDDFQAMTTAEIESVWRKRHDEANAGDWPRIFFTLATKLGQSIAVKHGTLWEYKTGEMVVRYTTDAGGQGRTSVTNAGILLYEEGGRIVPGDWFNVLKAKLDTVQENERREAERKEREYRNRVLSLVTI